MGDMLNSRAFRAALWTLVILLIILLATQVSFVFVPLIVIFNTLFFPFLVAGFLYFLTYPLVDVIERAGLPRWAAIGALYIGVFGLMAILILLTGPPLQREVEILVRDAPAIVQQLGDLLVSLQENPLIARLMEEEPQLIEQAADRLTESLSNIFSLLLANFSTFLEFAADLVTVLLVVPFILFYVLKDGKRWPDSLWPQVPQAWRGDLQKALSEINRGISSYIQGIVLVCLTVGVLVFIGYTIIGMDYPLILAVFAMVTNVIPFLGPIIGSVPAVLVGLLHSPAMALKVIVVVFIVQQVESLLISPQVMGKKLAIGPLTVLLLILVGGRMAGLLGMILALPAFVILKIIVSHGTAFLRHR